MSLKFLSWYIEHNVWRNWGLQLLVGLDRQRQRILKSFLLEMLTCVGTIFPGSFELDISYLDEQVASGEFERKLQSVHDTNPNREG
jgi:hypothetical protein